MAMSTTDSALGGDSSSNNTQKTPAQLLLERHEAAEAHKATVEDVADEEDFAPPPPSSTLAEHKSPNGTSVTAQDTGEMSEKAVGKQKAQSPAARSKVLDTQSEESFPALGGGPKSRAPATPGAWGSKKAKASSRATPDNVSNGTAAISSPISSGASTPLSGVLTPASTNMSMGQRGPVPVKLSIPGKYSAELALDISQVDKRKSSTTFPEN